MKGLVLCGAKCNSGIWDLVKPQLSDLELDYVDYPHDVLMASNSVRELSKWVAAQYGPYQYDVLIGHSMGGQVALEMLSQLIIQPQKVVLIESNPVPSGPFYRNLMTREHMNLFRDQVEIMFKKEGEFYQEKLLCSLQDGFDRTQNIRAYNGEVVAIYGDRERPGDIERYSELRLPEDIMSRMQIFFISHACHLPMLENPNKFSDILHMIFNV